MKRFVAVPILVGALVAPLSGLAADSEDKLRASPQYKKLNAAELDQGHVGVDKVKLSFEINASNVEIMAMWFADAYGKRAKKNPRYGLAYSETLYLLASANKRANHEDRYHSLMETGTAAFFSSQLIALEDLQRCSDQTAGRVYRSNWGGELAKIFSDYYASVSQQTREQILMIILRVAALRDVSDPDRVACSSGIKAMGKALENNKCNKTDNANGTHLVNQRSTTYVCDAVEYVTLISDKEWKSRRLQTRIDFRQRMIKFGN